MWITFRELFGFPQVFHSLKKRDFDSLKKSDLVLALQKANQGPDFKISLLQRQKLRDRYSLAYDGAMTVKS